MIKGTMKFDEQLRLLQAQGAAHGVSGFQQSLQNAACRVYDAVDTAACIARTHWQSPSDAVVLELSRLVLEEMRLRVK